MDLRTVGKINSSNINNINNLEDVDNKANKDALKDVITSSLTTRSYIDEATLNKYGRYGLNWNEREASTYSLDQQLADVQSNWSKLGNAIAQTIVSEVAIGIPKGFSDLTDIILGKVFQSDNDFQNPISKTLEEWQEKFKNEVAPIYSRPGSGFGNGTDFGWWMQNIPSVASTLTLLIPGASVGKVTSYLGTGIRSAIKAGSKYTRKANNAIRRALQEEELTKIGKVQNWINKPNIATQFERHFGNAGNALAMRTIENYQEARQVYNDMYEDAFQSLNEMSDEQYQKFIENNSNLLNSENIDINNRQSVAKVIAKASADNTFKIDLGNLLFDVIQVYNLGNPLKLPKSLRTTRKINKAQRESKIFAKYGDVEGQKILQNRSKTSKVKDFIGDFAKSRWIITSELSEGVEEAVNYIAQQEGMHFGNTILDPEHNNEYLDERLISYIHSPELWESAFWGVLGGVVFQSGGSGIKRVYNATAKTISKNKNKDKDKNEKISWKAEFQTAENKTRIEEIDSRYNNIKKLRDSYETIYTKGESPFDDDSTDGSKRKLDTQLEKDAAWSRAIDQYIVTQTMSSIDAGNFDLFKDFLRDNNVREVLENIYQQDNNEDNKIDIESLISRMDEIEKIYSDNLITVNGLLGNLENVPIEIVNLIARDNTYANVKIKRIQDKIDAYNTSAEANKFRFNGFLSNNMDIDYKQLTSVVTATNYLKELKSRKEEIKSDKKLSGSIAGKVELNNIDSRIRGINKYLQSLISTEYTISDKISNVINTLFANFQSTSEDSSDYIDLISAIANRDIKRVNNIIGSDFELTDDELISIFGEAGTESGLYYVTTNKILDNFGVTKDSKTQISKFVENAPNLADDYTTIASLEIAKLIEEGKIVNTVESVKTAVNRYHNVMDKARSIAIDKASNVLLNLSQKYGKDTMLDRIFNNSNIPNITNEDNKLLKDALDILNLTSPSNEQLIGIIQARILLGDYERSVNEAKVKKSDEGTNDNGEILKEDKEIIDEEQPEPSPKDKIKITKDIDNNINADFVENSDIDGIKYIEDEDEHGNSIYELITNDKSISDEKRDELVKNNDLFEGYDKNNSNPYRVTDNPVIGYDNNHNLFVIKKGRIEYRQRKQQIKSDSEVKQPKSTNPNPPTGDELENINNDDYTEIPEQLSDEEAQRNLDEENRLIREQKLRSELRKTSNKRAKSLKEAGATNEEILVAVEKIFSDFREEHKNESNIEDIITFQSKFISEKYDLLSFAEKVDTLRSSTTIETEDSGFSDEFKQQVKDLVLEYVKAANIRQPKNGKLYINFEDFIRNINKMYNDTYAGEDVYNILKNYLSSNENKDIVLTDDINDPDFLDNVLKDADTRRVERIGKREKYRVSIDKLFEKGDDTFKKEFDNLRVGDTLDVTFTINGLILSHNGQTVGELPFPTYTLQHDGYQMPNKSWLINVYHDGRKTNIRNYLSELSKNDKVNDLINSFLYDDLSDSDINKIVDEIFDTIYSEHPEFFVKNPNKYDAVEFIANIWRYKATPADFSKPANERFDVIDLFIDDFFNKLYDSYDAITNLAKAISDNKNVEVKVANINDGELIRNVVLDPDNITPTEQRNNYSKFTQSNQAFKEGLEVEIGAVTENGKLTLDSGEVKEHSKLGSIGTIHVIVPNRSGKNNFVIATPVTINDENIDKSSDAYKIIQGARKYLNDTISEYLQNPTIENYNKLVIVIDDLLNNDNNHVSLFFGKYIYHDKDGISIRSQKGNRNGKFLKIYKPSINNEYDFIYNNGEENSKAERYSLKDNAELFKNSLNNMLNDCRFSLSFLFLNNRYSKDKNNSLIGYTAGKQNPNKFAIGIKGRFYFEYNSLTDAFIKGGLIRVNTKLEDGSNYRRKGENQGANQILEISMNINTTPVEDNESVDIIDNNDSDNNNKPSTAEEILNNESADNAIDKLVELALPNLTNEDKNNLKELNLLPKSIIFVPELRDNDGNIATAQVNITTSQVTVSSVWTDMFNGSINGIINIDANRKQAIRKLIHEQLHAKIHQGNEEDIIKNIKSIYNEFKEYIDASNDEIKNRFNQYLYENKTNDNERLEEFLVDSITSKELAELLSNIETTYNVDENKVNKESIWDKILNLIAKIFNYNIDKSNKNLLQKELYALQDALVVEEQEVEPESDILNLDDSLLNSIDGDIMNSTTVEKVPNDLSINVYTTEMQQIKDKAIANGTFMKAPNGKPTNLNEKQWLQVRTKAFKNWFGDWENDLANASKVIDENGEPLVVYHHTDNPNLTEFSTDFDNYFAKDGGTKEAIFFDENETGTLNRKYDIPVFLNIKDLNEYNETKEQLHQRGTTYRQVVNESASKNNIDGGVHMKDFDDNKMEHQSIWIIHNPNQAKSATDNIGTFSRENNDIRYSTTTETAPVSMSISSFIQSVSASEQPELARLIYAGEITTICR